jgi:hypothetical protein
MRRREFCLSVTLAPLGLNAAPLSPEPDLRLHASRSFQFLEGAVEQRDRRPLPFFRINMQRKPGLLEHEHWDWSENLGRWLYGRMFARQVLDDFRDLRLEESLAQAIAAGLGPDGLHYYPRSITCGSHESDGVAMLWDNRSIFMGLTQLWAVNRDNAVRKQLDRMVESLEGYAIREGDEAYFAVNGIPPGYRPKPVPKPVAGQNIGGFIVPLLDYHRLSGNQRALDLALRLANFIVTHQHAGRPDEAGSVLAIANVHGALFSISGVVAAVEYGGKKEHLDWARQLYIYARDHLASTYGWVAEHETADPKRYPKGATMSTEGCAIVDMVHLATRLAAAGYPDCWNVVERYLRNYLTAGQLNDTTRLGADVAPATSGCATNDHMPGRAAGAFVGWGGPADLFNATGRHGAMIQNCCGSHYPFGLHLVHRNLVTSTGDATRLNLLVSHDTAQCRVTSSLPGQGRVRVEMKAPGDLWIRLPDWTEQRTVKVSLGGRTMSPEFRDGFVGVRHLRPTDAVQLEFPLRRQRRRESFMGHTVDAEWLGDSVVSISPEGSLIPLFERARLITGK